MTGRGWTQRLGTNGRRVLFFSVGAVVLVLIVATIFFYRAKRVATGGLYTVKEGTLRIVITEDGELAAKESEKVVADIDAQAKIVWIIDEGTFVRKGTKLVELDKTELESFLESLELELISLHANYKNAEGRLKVLKADAPQQIKKLKFEVEKANARWEKALALQPREEYKDVYSESELRDAKIAVDEAKMNLETAQLALELYEKYTYPQDLADTEANLEQAKRLWESQVEKKKEVEEQLAKMELVAPSDGLVIYGESSAERRRWRDEQDEITVGSNVYKGQVVITLPNVTKMQVGIRVHESDYPKIKKGLPATIRVLDKDYTGKVASIGALARERDGWRSEGVKVFDVAVDVEGTYTNLRPGVSARVDILVDEIPGVLLIPIEAVCIDRGTDRRFCRVRTPSGYEERDITLGASNNSFVIVTEGLKEDEQVYPYDPTARME
jgi:HlyD family secretion protein